MVKKRGLGGGRFSARRKQETVLRLLRGEDLEVVSRELGVTAAALSGWRQQFLAAGESSGPSGSYHDLSVTAAVAFATAHF